MQNPEYMKTWEIFEKLEKDDESVISRKINEYLKPLNLECIKGLKEKVCVGDNERDLLKWAFLKIANKEADKVESLIYQVIAEKCILINDLDILIMFYSQLTDYYEYFIVINNGLKLPHLYLKAKYLKTDIYDDFLENIKELNINEKMFYYFVFAPFLDKKLILDFFVNMENFPIDNVYINYQCDLLKRLPTRKYHETLGAFILYSDYVKALKILALMEIDHLILVKSMIDECFTNQIFIRKVFIHFLSLLKIFKIGRNNKKLILYAWLRYFLYKKLLGDFFDLLFKLKHYKYSDAELKVFLNFESYFLKRRKINKVQHALKKAKHILNPFAKHTFKQIFLKYV